MSGLQDLYREIILDHYRSPRNRGELPAPPATRVEGFNPLCGDEIVVYVDVKDGVLGDIRIGGQGCSIDAQCCSGGCVAGVCGGPSCLNDGAACSLGVQCCTGSCAGGVS